MAKYGAIGAGIGTFVGGPVGTVVGGAIGAGVGAVASLIPAEDVAKFIDKRKETHADNKAFRRQLKLAKAEGKGEKSVVKNILESVVNIEKEITGKKGKGLSNVLPMGENTDIYSSLTSGVIGESSLGIIAKGLSTNANSEKTKGKEEEKTLTFGESQIVETIKEIGENIVNAVNAINPTKNDIDYANGLYRATNKGFVSNSVTNFYSDTQREDTVAT